MGVILVDGIESSFFSSCWSANRFDAKSPPEVENPVDAVPDTA
jgi:hypothetical protein